MCLTPSLTLRVTKVSALGLTPPGSPLLSVTSSLRHHGKKKADVNEPPEGFNHVGLLVNQPPARPGCPSMSHPKLKSVICRPRSQVGNDSSDIRMVGSGTANVTRESKVVETIWIRQPCLGALGNTR